MESTQSSPETQFPIAESSSLLSGFALDELLTTLSLSILLGGVLYEVSIEYYIFYVESV